MAPATPDDRTSNSASTASDASKLPVRSSKRIQKKAFEQIMCLNSEPLAEPVIRSPKRGGGHWIDDENKVKRHASLCSPKASAGSSDDDALVESRPAKLGCSKAQKRRVSGRGGGRFRLHSQQRGLFKRNTVAVGAANIRRRNRQLYDIAKAPRGNSHSMPQKAHETSKFYHDWECGEESNRFTELRVCDSIAHASRYSGALQKWIQVFGGGSTHAFVKLNRMPTNSALPWWQQQVLPPMSATDRCTFDPDNRISVDISSTGGSTLNPDNAKTSSTFFLQPVFVEFATIFGYPPRCMYINHDVLLPLDSPRSTDMLRTGDSRETSNNSVFKCFLCNFQQMSKIQYPSIHQPSLTADQNAADAADLSGKSTAQEHKVQNDVGFVRFLLHLQTEHGPRAQSLEFDLDLARSKLYFRLNTAANANTTNSHTNMGSIIQQLSTGQITSTLQPIKIPPRTYIHSVSGRPINPIAEASLLLGNTTRIASGDASVGYDAIDSDEEQLPAWQESMSMWQTNDYIDISPDEKWLLQSWKLFALSCGLCQRTPTLTMYEALKQFIGIHLRGLTEHEQQQTAVDRSKQAVTVKWLSIPPFLGTFHLQGAINHNELAGLRRLYVSVRTDLIDKTKENEQQEEKKNLALQQVAHANSHGSRAPKIRSSASINPPSRKSVLRTSSLSSRKVSSNESSSQGTAYIDMCSSQTDSDTSSVFLSAKSNRNRFQYFSSSASSASHYSSPLAYRSTTTTTTTSASTPTRSTAATRTASPNTKTLPPPRRTRSGGRK